MIDGIAYLLATDSRGNEWVARYNANEMEELFTRAERVQLAGGHVVVHEEPRRAIRVSERRERVSYIDMLGAARMAAACGPQ